MTDGEKAAADWAKGRAAEPAEIRALKGEIARLRREVDGLRGGTAIIVDAVREAYQDPPDIVVPRTPPTDKRKGLPVEEAVLHVSDSHFGKRTSSYSSDIARDRAVVLAGKVARITETRRAAAKIDVCHLLLGGDLVEGEEVFPAQSHQIDQSLFDQAVKTAPEILSGLILALAATFREVRVAAIAGNHGVYGGHKARSHPRTNWDMVAVEAARLMVNGPDRSRLAERVSWDIAHERFWTVSRVFDWGVLQVHGDQIRGGFAGFPWYSVGRKAMGWIDSIREDWDLVFLGHFHTAASAVLNERMFLANGAWESDNEYARSNMASAGHPCQRLCFFEAEHGLVADHLVWLADAGRRVPSARRRGG